MRDASQTPATWGAVPPLLVATLTGDERHKLYDGWCSKVEAVAPLPLGITFLVLPLWLTDLGCLLLFQGGCFSGQLKLRSRCVVLHVVRKVVAAG